MTPSAGPDPLAALRERVRGGRPPLPLLLAAGGLPLWAEKAAAGPLAKSRNVCPFFVSRFRQSVHTTQTAAAAPFHPPVPTSFARSIHLPIHCSGRRCPAAEW